ncbi:thialysine N-epsilon-acetyltransferase-like [Ylistrum balloti]|uniref:thialysine N-epsilon-acetyltransferase-like n=1 Tax=Ylistrum balloti TaxID=509963 RepID=UPI002905A27B|nr:thialysine N-epsilon-acetyltransferase-like [Ylistrum balloti]
MSEFTLRRAVDDDTEEIFRLCLELAACSDEVEALKTTPETLRRDRKYYECFVAEESSASDSEPKPLIGYALYSYTYSSWNGRSAFLNDIYVSPNHRGKGIGSALLKKVAQDVVENGCILMEWCVLEYNIDAIEFYKSKGAFDLTEADRIHLYRLPNSSLKQLAK